MKRKEFEFLVAGGEATAGPPIGPVLGPLGVNLLQVANRINELTKGYVGMKVPVKVSVDVETKEFEVEIGIPTTSALIVKEAGVEKGASNPKAERVGNLTMEQVIRIAKLKLQKSYAKDIKGAVKEVLGSCISMGVTVEGKDPREIVLELNEGKWHRLVS